MNTTTARMAAVSLALLAAAPVTAAQAKKHRAPRPDLAATSVSKPPATSAGAGRLSITVKIKNRGKATAKKSTVGLYLAARSKHSSKDLRLARKSISKLKKGKSSKVTIKTTLPAVAAATVKAGTYHVIGCADDRKKVKESNERNNCRAAAGTIKLTGPIQPPPPPPPPPPAPNPTAPAFTLADGIDWGFVEDATASTPAQGDHVTATLTAGNGLPGAAGYTRSSVGPQDLVTGTSTDLDFSSTSNDDGQTEVTLPFAFGFGGVSSSAVSVSTNGWVSFGAPAWDYFDDYHLTDYRGANAVVGRFERGIMPYFDDLNVGNGSGPGATGPGTVTEVVAPDNSYVAFHWDAGQCCAGLGGGAVPRRTFEVVLYRDGRFRFDYPGPNDDGGNKAFVGYSLGTGANGLDVVSSGGTSVPGTSILYTPKPVAAPSVLPAGQATLTLPASSSLVSADAGCTQTAAPTATATGTVTCATPALAAGQQKAFDVTFAAPPNAPGQSSPANFGLSAALHAGSASLSDDAEIDTLGVDMRSTTLTVTPGYVGPSPPVVGSQATFQTNVTTATGGLDHPTVTFTLPANTTLDSIKIGTDDVDCDAAVSGTVLCRLPNGSSGSAVDVVVTPTAAAAGNPMTLSASAQSLNAPEAHGTIASPNVTP